MDVPSIVKAPDVFHQLNAQFESIDFLKVPVVPIK